MPERQSSVDLIEEYIGDDLSRAKAQLLANAPLNHIGSLLERLAPFYFDWLEREEIRREKEAESIYYLVEFSRAVPTPSNWRAELEKLKGLLLYFPRLAVSDPLAEVMWPLAIYSIISSWDCDPNRVGRIPVTNEDTLRSELEGSLCLLAELASLAKNGEIVLVPRVFALDYKAVQSSAREELKAADKMDDLPLATVKVHGQVCAMCDFSAVAGNRVVRKLLEQEYDLGNLQPVRGIESRVAAALLRYRVPSLDRASLEEVIALRRNETAFKEWRSVFGELLDRAERESLEDDERFQLEFQQAARESLEPRLEAIDESLRGSPVLSSILTPAALSIAAGVVTFHLTGDGPLSSWVGAGLSPIPWVVRKLEKRYSKAGKKARLLRQFYGHLTEAPAP